MANFRDVSEAFGGSIFAEDYRGNLQAANEALTELERTVAPNSEPQAAFLLLRVAYHILCGELALARAFVERLHSQCGNLPVRWTLRCGVYDAFLRATQRFPPLLRFRPELGGHLHDERTARTNYKKACEDFAATSRALNQTGEQFEELDYLELWIGEQMLRNCLVLWTTAFPLHPKFPVCAFNWNAEVSGATRVDLTRQTECLQMHLEAAEGLNMLGVAFNIAMRMWELADGSGNSHSAHLLYRLERQCATTNDRAGLGVCKMFAADRLVSPPFSNPTALNLVPIDGDDAGFTNGQWDPVEARIVFQDSPRARQLYAEAYELFETASSPRGCAAALLRQACVEHMRICSIQFSRPSTDLAKHFGEVEAMLSRAESLFSLDMPNIKLVQGHRILLRLNMGMQENTAESAAAIGEWARVNENDGIAHFIGLLIFRFGRQQLVEYNRIEVALSCFRCTQALFTATDNIITRCQAFVAQLQVHLSMSNISEAKQLLDADLHLFVRSMAHIDSLLGAEQRLGNRRQLLLLRKNLLNTVDYPVMYLFSQAGDAAGADNWDRLMDDWNAHEEMKREVGSATDSEYIRMLVLCGRALDMNEAELDRKMHGRYLRASGKYKQAIANFDLDEAESLLHSCNDTLDAMPGSLYTRLTLQINSYFMLGEINRCRTMLSRFPDSELLDDRTIEVRSSDLSSPVTGQSKRLQNISSAENAIALCVMTQDWQKGASILSRILELSPDFLHENTSEKVTDLWQRFAWSGLLAERQCQYRIAYTRYMVAYQLISRRRSRIAGKDARTMSFSTLNIGEVFLGLVRISLKCAESGLPFVATNNGGFSTRSWVQLGLTLLEEGRAQSLLEDLTCRGAFQGEGSLSRIALKAYQKRLLIHLQALPPREISADEQKELQALEQSLATFNNDVNCEDISLNDSGFGKELPDLPSVLTPDEVLVSLGFSKNGSVIIVLTSDGIISAKAQGDRDVDIRRHALRVMKSMKKYSIRRKDSDDPVLQDSLKKIAECILLPIAHIIRQKRHIIFAAGQPLTAFPFSALPLDGKPICQSAAVSITPSLSVYYQLSRRKPRIQPKVSVVVKPGSDVDHLKTGERPLPMAGIEALHLSQLFGGKPRLAKKLSREAFCRLLNRSSIMHIATHGRLDPRSPWLSYISLKEKMRVIDLSQVRRGAPLIVFAACLSGLGEATIGNDVLGFSHAVLESGASAFLGALWEVDDIATMLLMVLFYKGVKNCGSEGKTVAELWRDAVVQFLDLDSEKAKLILVEMRDVLQKCKEKELNPENFVEDAEAHLLRAEKVVIDFQHPFYYASFSLFGCGSLVCCGG